MTSAPRSDEHAQTESPGVPGVGTWRAVYLFVIGWFVLTVILLTVFTAMFS